MGIMSPWYDLQSSEVEETKQSSEEDPDSSKRSLKRADS